MNMKVAKLSDVQATREADVFDKIFWISVEVRELAARMTKGAIRLEVARAQRNLPDLQSAYTELETIRDQTSQMLEGLRHAIEKEKERTQ